MELEKKKISSGELFDVIGDAMFLVEAATHKIIDVNQSAIKLFGGRDKSDFIGKIGTEFHLEKLSEQEALELLQELQKELFLKREFLFKTLHGSPFWANVLFHLFPEEGIVITRLFSLSDLKIWANTRLTKQFFYELLLRSKSQGYGVFSTDGSIIEIGGSLINQSGYHAKDLINKNIFDFIHPDDLPTAITENKRLLSGELKSSTYSSRLRMANGRYVWVENSNYPRLDISGNVIGIITNVQNKVQKAAHTHDFDTDLGKEIYNVLVDEQAGSLVLSPEQKVLYASNQAAFLLEKKQDELIGSDFKDFFTNLDNEKEVSVFFEKHHENYELSFNYFQQSNESTKSLSVDLRKTYFDGKVKNYQIIIKDSSIFNKNEITQLRESYRFQSLVEGMNEGILQLNDEGNIVFANKQFLQMLNIGREQVLGLSASELMFDYEGNNVAKLRLLSIESKGFKNQYELKYEKENGDMFWLWANGSAFYNMHNNIEGSFVIYNDITDRKDAELRLMGAILDTQEVERSRLAEELHDSLGQILTAIKLNLSVLKPEKTNDSKQMVYDNFTILIDQAIQETRNISHNLMPKSIHDFGLVHAAELMFERINKIGKIKVIFDVGVEINGDFQYNINIYRIIQEAVNNAMKYAKADRIDVVFDTFSDKLYLVNIKDNGLGFDVGVAMRKGGLGLKNIVRRAEFLGGTAEFVSSPGAGTELKVLIPIKLRN